MPTEPDLAVLAETGELDRLLDPTSAHSSSSHHMAGVSVLVAAMSALSACLGFFAAKAYYNRQNQYLSINV